MRQRLGFVVGAFALAAAVVLAGCQQMTTSSTTSTKVTTVVANVKGTVVNEANQPIAGAKIVFDTPNGVDMTTTNTTTTSKAITTVTTATDGTFSLDGLGSGTYTAMVNPPITGSGATTAVAYTATKITIVVPSLASLLNAVNATNGSTSVVIGTNIYTTVNQGPVTLNSLGGSIKGVLVAQQNGNAQQAVATKKVAMNLGATIYYPTVAADGTISYLNYVTTTTTATGGFTFSNLPLMTYANGTTLMVETSPGGYTNSGTVAYTTSASLPMAIPLGLYGFSKDVDISSTPLVATDTTAYPALLLVSSSTVDVNGSTATFAVASPIVLTFNNTLTGYDTTTTYLQVQNPSTLAWTNVLGTVALSGKTLTFTPSANLTNGASYRFYFSVTDGITQSYTTGSPINFSAIASTTVPTAITDLALNTVAQAKYDNGATSFDVSFTYNSGYSYQLFYKTKATDAGWTAGSTITNSNVVLSGTTGYYSLALSGTDALVSGQTVSLKLRITSAATGTLYSESNTITVTDGTNPTSVPALTYVTGTRNNTTGTTISYVVYTLTSGEPMSTPSATLGTAITGASLSYALSSDAKTAYITVGVPAGQTLVGNTLVITYKDAAGNQYQVAGTNATSTQNL